MLAPGAVFLCLQLSSLIECRKFFAEALTPELRYARYITKPAFFANTRSLSIDRNREQASNNQTRVL